MPVASRPVPHAGEPELLAVLRRLPHFADLTPELLSLVAARARRRTASRGEVLFRAGEPGDEFYLIITGSVGILEPTAHGEEVAGELGAGEWFGEMALITGEPRSATAVAAAATDLGVLARTDFQAGGAGPCARPRAESHLEPPPPQPPAASKATGRPGRRGRRRDGAERPRRN